MSNVGFFTWLKFGRPQAGTISTMGIPGVQNQPGPSLKGIFERNFGDPAELSVLDLGAGTGDSALGKAIIESPWRKLSSVEAFIPYIHQLTAQPIMAADHDVIEARIEEYVREQLMPNHDVAVLCDSLHVLSKADALAVLRKLEKVVRRGIVIHSPLGKLKDDSGDHNVLQRQRSVWRARDFSKLGYAVSTVEGANDGSGAQGSAWAIKKIGG